MSVVFASRETTLTKYILKILIYPRGRLDPFILGELKSTQWIRLFDLEFDIS